MGGRFLDYMSQGNHADRPLAADVESAIAPNAAAIYVSNDVGILSFFDGAAIAWIELNLAALTGLFVDLGDVDPAGDGQIYVWDASDAKLVPGDIVNGAGITVNYDGVTHTYEIVSNVSQYTDENAMDAIAAMVAAGTHVGVDIVYDDATNSLSFSATDTGGGSIATLTDVDVSTPPEDGQVLVYDEASEKWIPADQTGGGGGGSTIPWREGTNVDIATTGYGGGLTFMNRILVKGAGLVKITHIGIKLATAGATLNLTPVIYSLLGGSITGPEMRYGPTVAAGVVGENLLALNTPLAVAAGTYLWVGVHNGNPIDARSSSTAEGTSIFSGMGAPPAALGGISGSGARITIYAVGTEDV